MDEAVSFRLAEPTDAPALARVRLETREETYRGIYPDAWIDGFDLTASEERFRGMIADAEQRVYLIEAEGALAGYLCYGRPLEATMPAGSVCINMLYLLRAFQRRGIGARALEHVRSYCRSLHTDRFYNGCNMHNANAVRFYLTMGGRIVAEHGGHENRALDQYVFEHVVDMG